MNTTATGRDAINVDLHHFAIRERALQRFSSGRIGTLVAKLRRNHGTIAHIKIDLAGGKIIIGKVFTNIGRRFEHHHIQFAALGIGGRTQNVQMALGHRMVE